MFNLIVSEGSTFEAINSVLQEKNDHPGSISITMQLYLITDNNADLAKQIRAICENYTDSRPYIEDVEAIQQEAKRIKTTYSIFLYGFIT